MCPFQPWSRSTEQRKFRRCRRHGRTRWSAPKWSDWTNWSARHIPGRQNHRPICDGESKRGGESKWGGKSGLGRKSRRGSRSSWDRQTKWDNCSTRWFGEPAATAGPAPNRTGSTEASPDGVRPAAPGIPSGIRAPTPSPGTTSNAAPGTSPMPSPTAIPTATPGVNPTASPGTTPSGTPGPMRR
jgi:hypothetical protein